jgi:hypothetical protein
MSENDDVCPELKKLFSLHGADRFEYFKTVVAPMMGRADDKTIALRERMRAAGVSVAFSCGANAMSFEKLVEFIESPEFQKVLND